MEKNLVKKITILLILLCTCYAVRCQNVVGRVFDERGESVPYASVYLREYPAIGTVTDLDGRFSLDVEKHRTAHLEVSFLGYAVESHEVRKWLTDSLIIHLREQPITLDQLVKTQKALKTKRQKRKSMEQLLRQVGTRMDVDFPDKAVKYHVVSDAKVYSDEELMVFEQMIGNVVEMPGKGKNGKDTIQFYGELAKRYFDREAEDKYHNANIPKVRKKNQQRLNNFVSRVDSGTVVHRFLWGGNVRHYFRRFAEHPKRWALSRENESRSVLTYTETHNFLGIVKIELIVNYTIDNATCQLIGIAESMKGNVRIPFGYKLDSDMLSWLNIVNINEEAIEKFRLKYIDVDIKRNELFTLSDDKPTTVRERNYRAKIVMRDTKDQTINMRSDGTVKVVDVQLEGVKPYSAKQLNKPVKRQYTSPK